MLCGKCYYIFITVSFSVTVFTNGLSGDHVCKKVTFERKRVDICRHSHTLPKHVTKFGALDFKMHYTTECLHPSWFWRTTYGTKNVCCPGYSNQKDSCHPICYGVVGSNGCNGGECVAPDMCKCETSGTGPRCNYEAVCTVHEPCYPGVCSSGTTCKCSVGFLPPNCTTVLITTITNASAKLSAVNPYTGLDVYSYTGFAMIDIPIENYLDAEKDDLIHENMESTWINKAFFDSVHVNLSGILIIPDTGSHKPDYVKDAKIGITEASVSLEILSYEGRLRYSRVEKKCPGANISDPIVGLLHCSLHFDQHYKVLSGDRVNLNFILMGGGYASLMDESKEVGQLVYRQQEGYPGAVLTYLVDLDPPIASDPNMAFHIGNQFTKGEVFMAWQWTDTLSGIDRYTLEVFHLRSDGGNKILMYENRITCLNPHYGSFCNRFLDPIYMKEFKNIDKSYVKDMYAPKDFGMYSFLLEISDKANNSEYVTRYVLYDSESKISLRTDNSIKVLTASPESNYTWQAVKSDQTVVELNITWENYFVNELHVRHGVLNEIEMYKPQLRFFDLEPSSYRKVVNETLNDLAPRNRKAIPNKLGIIRFDFFVDVENEVERRGIENIEWTILESPLATEVHWRTPVVFGRMLKIYVRARDVMDNVLVSSTWVGFDASSPNVQDLKFAKDTENQKYTVMLRAIDLESGILFINLKISRASDNIVLHKQSFKYKELVSNGVVNSYKYPAVNGVIFDGDFKIKAQECWFTGLSTGHSSFHVTVTALNGAMLNASETRTFTLDMSFLKETQNYPLIYDLVALQTYTTSARIGWKIKPGCYKENILRIHIEYTNEQNGKHHLLKEINPDVNTYDLSGLSPDSKYNLKMSLDTPSVVHVSSITLTFHTTREAQTDINGPPHEIPDVYLKIFEVCGVVIATVVLLLLIIAITVWIILKMRKSSGDPHWGTLWKHATDDIITYRQFTAGIFDVEDIVKYSDMTFERNPDWEVAMANIALGTLLRIGRFARIFESTVYMNGKSIKAAAKVLLEGHTEEDELLMKAKINFLATQDLKHSCVIEFIGAVTETQKMGPILILEYCGYGNLREWLENHRNTINEENIERMFQFSYAIARGMEYLSSNQVRHRRLSAGNILLTDTLNVKISGFEPRHGESMQLSYKKEQVPVKWFAPECFYSASAASEKSDVWSFGVTLWEIFTLGEIPYSDYNNDELPSLLNDGFRLRKPEYADDMHFEIMRKCWQKDPSKRPTFADINKKIQTLFRQSSSDVYYYTGSIKAPSIYMTISEATGPMPSDIKVPTKTQNPPDIPNNKQNTTEVEKPTPTEDQEGYVEMT